MPSVSYHCSPCSDLYIISVPNSWWSLSLGEGWYGYLPMAKHSAVDYYQYPVQLWVPDWLLSTHEHNEASLTKVENNAVVVWTEMSPWTHVCECLSPQALALLCVLLPLLPLISTLSYILSSFLTSTDTPNRTPPFQMDFHLKIQNQMHIWARTCSRSLPGPRLPHLIEIFKFHQFSMHPTISFCGQIRFHCVYYHTCIICSSWKTFGLILLPGCL